MGGLHVTDRAHDLRHDAARRRAGARLLAARRREAARWPASSTRSAWTSSRPGSRSRREADAEAVRQIATRGAAAGHRRAGALPAAPTSSAPARALEPARAAPHPHLHRHLRPAPRAQAAHDARGVPRRRGRRGPLARAATPTTCSSRRRMRRAAICDFLCRVVEAVITAGAHDDQPAGHGRLLDARRDRATFFRDDPRRACRTPTRRSFSAHCHDDLGLAVANTLAAIAARRAAGRVHDQRHRRARRQRVARRDRDGDARARRSPAVRRPASTPREIYPTEPAADGAHRRSACRRTRRSSAATRSRTRPASTRTAC